jgi:hypothetical protein
MEKKKSRWHLSASYYICHTGSQQHRSVKLVSMDEVSHWLPSVKQRRAKDLATLTDWYFSHLSWVPPPAEAQVGSIRACQLWESCLCPWWLIHDVGPRTLIPFAGGSSVQWQGQGRREATNQQQEVDRRQVPMRYNCRLLDTTDTSFKC